MITIGHSRVEGTLVSGTRKGDGTGEILRAHGFRWFRSLTCWGLPHSRDRQAQSWKIEPCAAALRAAGHQVSVSIDEETRRPFAEVEAERADRAEERAERFAERSDRAADRSETAWQGVKRISDGIPFGQPILIGHHSEARAHRDQDRIDRGMRASIQEGEKAGYWAGRAKTAAGFQRSREDVPTTLRRIAKPEAEQRVYQRALAGDSTHGWEVLRHPGQGEELLRRIAELEEELAYWREIVTAAQAEGVKLWGPADFGKGDFVLCGCWYEVLRVNAKSLTVPAVIASPGRTVLRAGDSPYSWTDRLPYDKVRGRKSASEMDSTE